MAQHIIRDSKGRVEKILNDQEYAEHQKNGCFTKIFLFIISIIVVIAIAINGDNNEGKAGSEKIEKAVPKESSQLDVSTPQSNAQKEDAYSKQQQQPSAETTPLLEADIESSSESVEAVERESQDIELSSMTDDPEQEQHLSRKERRAFKKAQKRLQKEMEKEND